jgi:hypothetical protein
MKVHPAYLIGFLLLAGGIFWVVLEGGRRKPSDDPVPQAQAPRPPAPPRDLGPTRAVPDAPSQVVPRITPLPAAAAIPDPVAEDRAELDRVSLMLRNYRTLTGGNPVGTNAEIMAALMGGNPRQAQLGPEGGKGVNSKGELVDRWGTPYFFHQISGTHTEIRSAGPDRVMWTSDDIVLP